MEARKPNPMPQSRASAGNEPPFRATTNHRPRQTRRPARPARKHSTEPSKAVEPRLSFLSFAVFFQQLVQPLQLFRRQMFCFHQTHYQTLRRSAEQALDDVAHVLTNHLAATDCGLVKIGA